jgi:hypothetical protein
MTGQSKLPLTIGFANLAGEQAEAVLRQDRDVLGELFHNVSIDLTGRVPHAPILFLYTKLDPSGGVRSTPKSIRDIAEIAGAKLLVVALENDAESIVNTGKTAGPQQANLVFTNNRNGAGFARFFQELFKLMLADMEFLAAYALLCPQGAKQAAWLPGTIVIPEAGKLTASALATSALLSAFLDTSPGDRSLLELALQRPELRQASLTTSPNTMNFRVWSQMALQGWLTQEPDTSLPEAPDVVMKHFSVTEEGRATLPEFLAEFKRHQLAHGARMSEIMNAFCLPFAKGLRERITRAGGGGLDVELLISLTLTEVIAGLYHPEKRIQGLEKISNIVRGKLAEKAAPKGS